ncbi:MAG TPA: chaperone modulator CbpM [Terrimicrobiaceae bacterium]
MNTIQVFEPDPHLLYTIDVASRLTDLFRRDILIYCEHGLVSPFVDAEGGYYFNDDAIRVLRRIEYLRVACGVNLSGIKMAIELMNEVERLQAEVRFLRR